MAYTNSFTLVQIAEEEEVHSEDEMEWSSLTWRKKQHSEATIIEVDRSHYLRNNAAQLQHPILTIDSPPPELSF
ncbi:MAG: hypothetical protein Salg2KO_12490 [Salibacteraceae bacterium]